MFDGMEDSQMVESAGSCQVFVTVLINNTEIGVAVLPNDELAMKSTSADLHAHLQMYTHTVTTVHSHEGAHTHTHTKSQHAWRDSAGGCLLV